MNVNKKSFRYILGRVLLYGTLVISSLLMMVPFYWSLSTSLKLEQFVFASPPQWWPHPLTLASYKNILTRIPFLTYFMNSVYVSTVVTLAHVFFDTLAAYAFAKLKFPGRDKIFFIMLLALMIPFQVNLIPLYRIMSMFHWVDSYAALVIPSLTSIFGIFLMRQFFKTVPDDLIDAARMDGISEFGIVWRVMLPTAIPAVTAFGIFSVVAHWNDYFWPLIAVGELGLYTPPLGIAHLKLNGEGTAYGPLMAAATIVIAPLVLAFLLAQRRFRFAFILVVPQAAPDSSLTSAVQHNAAEAQHAARLAVLRNWTLTLPLASVV